jgi:hypothetical protein
MTGNYSVEKIRTTCAVSPVGVVLAETTSRIPAKIVSAREGQSLV